MCRGQNLGPKRACGQHEDAAIVENKVVDDRPSRGRCARRDVFLRLDNLLQALGLPTTMRPGQGTDTSGGGGGDEAVGATEIHQSTHRGVGHHDA